MIEVWIFIEQIGGLVQMRTEEFRQRNGFGWFPGSYYTFEGGSWLCMGKTEISVSQ